jgi:YggT family protein
MKVPLVLLLVLMSLLRCESFKTLQNRPAFKLASKVESSFNNLMPKNRIEQGSSVPLLVSSMYLAMPIVPVLAAQQDMALTVGRPVLDSFVNVLSLLMICRTVLSWYPKTDVKTFPYSLIVWPTEPLLAPTRAIVPPAFGVDVSSLVWIAVLSFIREVFTGQQGILTLMEKYPDTF